MKSFAAEKDRDRFYMDLALQEAGRAAEEAEIPVGAVIVNEGEVIGQGHNRCEGLQNPIAHAEILAIEAASSYLGSWRLHDCVLYVTLEPCIMCVGAILQARLPRLVFGCSDPKAGAVVSLYRLCEDDRLNHQVSVTSGVLERECSKLLKDFFVSLRDNKQSAVSNQQSARRNSQIS
jgi:tRNA(adenine34) deaminase